MTDPDTAPEVNSEEPAVHYVTERLTSGGEGPEGQPDTVNETPDTAAVDPATDEAPAETGPPVVDPAEVAPES